MKLFTLLRVEISKTSHSQAVLMTLLCPLAVVLLQLLVTLESDGKFIREKGWHLYWLSTLSLWYSFMLPLYIALVTCLVNAIEHNNQGWRLMAMMPVSRYQLFLAKALVSTLLVVLATGWMYLTTWISIGCLTLVGINHPEPLQWQVMQSWLPVLICCLPILIIGHAISWLSASLVPPLAVGVCMTMAAMTIGRSEQYWRFDPWTYPMITAMTQDPATQQLAQLLGAAVGLVLLLLTCWYCGKKQVDS